MLYFIAFLAGFLTAILVVVVLNRRAENAAFRSFWMPVIALLFMCLTFSARAQTNIVTPPALTNLVSTNLQKVANNILDDLAPVFSELTNYNDVALSLCPAYGVSDHAFGFIADMQVGLNDTFSVGLGQSFLGNQWYTDFATFKAGAPIILPVIGRAGYAYAEAGASIRDSDSTFGSVVRTGYYDSWQLSKTVALIAEVGVSKLSQRAGEDVYGGVKINVTPIKW